jgi:N-acetylglucosaminyldiphosphoundecaprenol N-acetyl-beta-D-mannosaminyltransferase
MSSNKIEIAGLKINNVSYTELLFIISDSLSNNKKTLITYANANAINLIYKNNSLKGLLNSFDIIHPDGVGMYAASKFLFGDKGFKERITGSDFYPMLITQSVKNNWKLFFFGHDEETLKKIQLAYPQLNICGMAEGYNYNDDEVITQINNSGPDILVIGLSFPKQEKWLIANKAKLSCKICLCTGEGIKVFAGIKTRGPKFFRKIGLEWLFRLLRNPLKYFGRYVIGNPLFLYRIIILKFRKFRG